MSTFEKIEKAVVDGYKKIEDGVVEGFEKIEDGVVGKFEEISDSFIEKHLMKDGETLEEAKERIAKEQAERTEKTNSRVNVEVPKYDHKAAMAAQKEMIEKSIEASKNAGKR